VRDPTFPDMPTFKEVCAATEGCETSGLAWEAWKAFFMAGFPIQKMVFLPNGTSREIVDTFAQAFADIKQRDDFDKISANSLGQYDQLTGVAAQAALDQTISVPPDAITYTVVWSLALANVVGAGLCIALSSSIARLTTIRFVLLAPFLFMLIAFAAFQSAQSLGDLVLRIRARLSWLMTGLYAICGIAFICFMAAMLNRDFPAGQLQNYLQLPWPLG
jgi:hypothetical protein